MLFYAFDKFNGAVRYLASSPEPLPKRLDSAWSDSIIYVRDLPPSNIANGLRSIQDTFKARATNPLTETQEIELAQEIVSLYTAIVQELEKPLGSTEQDE